MISSLQLGLNGDGDHGLDQGALNFNALTMMPEGSQEKNVS